MKNSYLAIFTLSALIAITSCNSEDPSIEGRWNIDSVTTQIDDVEISVITNKGWIEFKDDGAGEYEDGKTFSWDLSGKSLTMVGGRGARTFEVTTLKKKEMTFEITFLVLDKEAVERWKLSKI